MTDVRSTFVYVTTDPREPITIRLRPSGVEALDKIATETGSDRSKVARALIGAALASPAALSAARSMLAAGNL